MNTMNTRLVCCVTLALALASLVAALLLFLPRTRLTIVRSEHRKLWAVLVAGSKGEFSKFCQNCRGFSCIMSKQSHPRMSACHLEVTETQSRHSQLLICKLSVNK